jgi:hypothetical protein
VRTLWLPLLASCSFHGGLATGDGASDAGLDSAADATSDALPRGPALADQGVGYGGIESVSASLMGSASVGDIVLVLVVWNTSDPLPTLSDTRNSSFMLAQSYTGSQSCALYWAPVGTVSEDVITATFDNMVGNLMIAVDYTNLGPSPAASSDASSAPIDGTPMLALGSGTTVTSGTVTTVHGHDGLVALVSGALTPQTGSGYTPEAHSGYSLVEDRITTMPGSYQATAGFEANSGWCIGLTALVGL